MRNILLKAYRLVYLNMANCLIVAMESMRCWIVFIMLPLF